MKRLGVVLLSVLSLALISGRRQDADWQSPYTPTRLDWLALQCNVHHPQRYPMVHTSFTAIPPNKIEAVVKFDMDGKRVDDTSRKSLADEAKAYVRRVATAMKWNEPLEVHATEVFR